MNRTPPVVLEARIMAGTSIHDAALGLCQAAFRLGLMVSAEFNGNVYTASPDTKPGELVAIWDRRQRASATEPSQAERILAAAGPLIAALETREKHLGKVEDRDVFDMMVPVQALVALRKAVRS